MALLALSPPLGVRATLAHSGRLASAGLASTPAPVACDARVWLRLRLRLLRLHAALLERARFGACGWQAAADTSAPRDASSRLLALPRADGDVACCLWSDEALGRALAAAAHAVDAQPRPSDEQGAGAPAVSAKGKAAAPGSRRAKPQAAQHQKSSKKRPPPGNSNQKGGKKESGADRRRWRAPFLLLVGGVVVLFVF